LVSFNINDFEDGFRIRTLNYFAIRTPYLRNNNIADIRAKIITGMGRVIK